MSMPGVAASTLLLRAGGVVVHADEPDQTLQQALAGARELLNIVQGAQQNRLAGLEQVPGLGRRLLGIATGAAQLAQGLAEFRPRGGTLALQGRLNAIDCS
jgi:hypothetical protein